jgi:hypothetical protein
MNFKIKISRTSVLYGISENGNQNLEEYLKNKLQVQDKNTTLVEQKTKMKTMELNPKEFPTLSTWDPNFLNEILENLSKKPIRAKRKSLWRTSCGQQRCWKWT